MPVTLLRSVVGQVTRGGRRSVIVSRRGKSYDSGSICENALLPSITAVLAYIYVWDTIQMSEYDVKKRDVEKLNGLESKTPQHNVLREAWRSLIHR